jgi:4-amino-4-deoxy-L-arabinose transferase-like glycosyltransferase
MNREIFSDWSKHRIFLASVTVVFVVINAMILYSGQPTKLLVESDALTLYRMANQFLNEGAFLEGQRQPLYPLMMAMIFQVFGPGSFAVLVSVQIVFLFVIGVAAWYIARDYVPDMAHWVFALTILNPNAIANAHRPLADTLYAVLITLAVMSIISHTQKGGSARLIVPAALLGLAVLTRAETIYLCYTLPLALPLLAVVSGQGRLPIAFLKGLVALAVVWAVTLPWALHNQAAGHGLVTSASSKAADNIRFHFSLVEAARLEQDKSVALSRLIESEAKVLNEAGVVANTESARRYLFEYYIGRIAKSNPLLLARLFGRAWVAQFASGGGQTFNLVLGFELISTDKLMNESDWFDRFLSGFSDQSGAAALVTIICISFAVFLRIAGILGLVVIVIRRHYVILTICCALIAFKALVHIFYGTSRYRLAVEPMLMILAVYGLDYLRTRLFKRNDV